MDERTFFDLLFSQFAKTTQAETAFWMPEEDDWEITSLYRIYAVASDQTRKLVARGVREVDADFITAVHGCFPDLVRRLHAALDEADRLDVERDGRECLIAELAMESEERFQEIRRLSVELAEVNEECAQLEETLATARSKAADVLWKIERPM